LPCTGYPIKPYLCQNVSILYFLIIMVLHQVSNLICIENFSDSPQLGRFTLRTEGKYTLI
jgi:hypothetical protein